MKSSNESLPRTGEGIVIDIGTGNGRFVSRLAKQNSNKFYIGVDVNAKALEKPSIKTTRKPSKGGLPNAMFVQAAVEDLPEEFDGVADEIHIHFPWGSLLRAVATGDHNILISLRRIAASGCLLEIAIGIDPERDRTELTRLGISGLDEGYLTNILLPRYKAVGFANIEDRILLQNEWSRIETSWAKRLAGGSNRRVIYLVFNLK